MKKIHIILLLICVTVCAVVTGCVNHTSKKEKFQYWAADTSSLETLKNYVDAVTDQDADTYIPAEDRIAVFDFDGTLYCETFPIYGEWIMFTDYVLQTPEYDVPADIKAVAQELAAIEKAADIPLHMEQTHIHAHAKVFSGMSIEAYFDVIDAFKTTHAKGYDGMTRGEAFYRPMLEVIDYLIDNQFVVYICSGTNRITVRGLIEGVIDIPARQVIGTDFTIVASGQGDITDMHYNYTADDTLLMGDRVITKNVKMSKVAQLTQELGQQPVLVFGNSTGDVPMALYAQKDNPYPTEVFFVLCDDVQRDYGNLTKAQNMAEICSINGWQTISMANDWTTLFGPEVIRK